MKTAFRETAILTDASRRYRTSILLASDLNGEWSENSRNAFCERQPRPCVALSLTDEEYAALRDNPALRFGYVDKAGDTASPFTPEAWDERLF